jgi:hypothetical protein
MRDRRAPSRPLQLRRSNDGVADWLRIFEISQLPLGTVVLTVFSTFKLIFFLDTTMSTEIEKHLKPSSPTKLICPVSGCGKEGSKLCGGCRTIGYCSKEHQKYIIFNFYFLFFFNFI